MTQNQFEKTMFSMIALIVISMPIIFYCTSGKDKTVNNTIEQRLPDRLEIVSEQLEINDGGAHYNFFVLKDKETNQEFIASPRAELFAQIRKDK